MNVNEKVGEIQEKMATLNLDHIVKLCRDPAFRAAYEAQDLVVADGNPVVWLRDLSRRPVELVLMLWAPTKTVPLSSCGTDRVS